MVVVLTYIAYVFAGVKAVYQKHDSNYFGNGNA